MAERSGELRIKAPDELAGFSLRCRLYHWAGLARQVAMASTMASIEGA